MFVCARACVCVFEVLRALNSTVRGVTVIRSLATSGHMHTSMLVMRVNFVSVHGRVQMCVVCLLCVVVSQYILRQIVGRIFGSERNVKSTVVTLVSVCHAYVHAQRNLIKHVTNIIHIFVT